MRTARTLTQDFDGEGGSCPGPLAQSATAMLEGIGQRLWGFPPRLMAPIVSYLGPHDPVNKNGQLRLRYDRLRDPVVV